MGKSKNQKASILRTAANKRAEYRKWLALLAVGLIICIIAVFVYMYLISAMIITSDLQPGWIGAAIAAAILGYFGNKFSKAHREFESYLYVHNLTNEDIKDFLRNN